MSFKKAKQKTKRAGINLVKDLKFLDDTTETMVELCDATKIDGENDLSLPLLKRIVKTYCDAVEGAAPQSIDHHCDPNPHQSQYGVKEKTCEYLFACASHVQ